MSTPADPPASSSISNTELKHSLFLAMVEELDKSKVLEESSVQYLKDEYQRVFEELYGLQLDEVNLVRKSNMLSSDILTEQITLEKEKLREKEEEKELAKLNDICENVQIEMEFTEQRDVMTKFELAELQKVQQELQQTLQKNQEDNLSLVEPVLTGLRREVSQMSIVSIRLTMEE